MLPLLSLATTILHYQQQTTEAETPSPNMIAAAATTTTSSSGSLPEYHDNAFRNSLHYYTRDPQFITSVILASFYFVVLLWGALSLVILVFLRILRTTSTTTPQPSISDRYQKVSLQFSIFGFICACCIAEIARLATDIWDFHDATLCSELVGALFQFSVYLLLCCFWAEQYYVLKAGSLISKRKIQKRVQVSYWIISIISYLAVVSFIAVMFALELNEKYRHIGIVVFRCVLFTSSSVGIFFYGISLYRSVNQMKRNRSNTAATTQNNSFVYFINSGNSTTSSNSKRRSTGTALTSSNGGGAPATANKSKNIKMIALITLHCSTIFLFFTFSDVVRTIFYEKYMYWEFAFIDDALCSALEMSILCMLLLIMRPRLAHGGGHQRNQRQQQQQGGGLNRSTSSRRHGNATYMRLSTSDSALNDLAAPFLSHGSDSNNNNSHIEYDDPESQLQTLSSVSNASNSSRYNSSNNNNRDHTKRKHSRSHNNNNNNSSSSSSSSTSSSSTDDVAGILVAKPKTVVTLAPTMTTTTVTTTTTTTTTTVTSSNVAIHNNNNADSTQPLAGSINNTGDEFGETVLSSLAYFNSSNNNNNSNRGRSSSSSSDNEKPIPSSSIAEENDVSST